jgi:hypothetical protein
MLDPGTVPAYPMSNDRQEVTYIREGFGYCAVACWVPEGGQLGVSATLLACDDPAHPVDRVSDRPHIPSGGPLAS